jgi:hypothetical protein
MGEDSSENGTTISLKPATKARLAIYKAKLIGQRETSKVSFDDIINEFLDAAEKKKKVAN